MSHIFDFNPEKNQKLKQERGVSFEDIIWAVAEGDPGLITIINHPNAAKYPNQRILIVAFDNYAYLVPVVWNEDSIFLKTIIPSRKATRDYLQRREC